MYSQKNHTYCYFSLKIVASIVNFYENTNLKMSPEQEKRKIYTPDY